MIESSRNLSPLSDVAFVYKTLSASLRLSRLDDDGAGGGGGGVAAARRGRAGGDERDDDDSGEIECELRGEAAAATTAA